ncbi:putative mitochondrial carrier domain superfamily [Helianthus anomalus]
MASCFYCSNLKNLSLGFKRGTHSITISTCIQVLLSILQGPRGLYAGFNPAVIGSTLSWGLYFYFYNSAKQRYMENQDKSSAYIHLASAAEAGGLVCLFTNPVWVVKTRLQLQTPQHHGRPYSGFNDAFKTILKDEGWRALYKGLLPGLLLVRFGIVISVLFSSTPTWCRVRHWWAMIGDPGKPGLDP